MVGRGQERKKSYKSGMLVVYIVVLLLFGVVMFGGRTLRAKDNDYRLREEALKEQIAQQHAVTETLKQYDEYAHTKKYIEEVAREKLGLVYPDEIIFKAIEE
ncbi:MAG: septum formation initiator family protein [Lachnospiraceae bacterium]|nr:septum formation initiator family protein [Lachnospiraceae bacterium]